MSYSLNKPYVNLFNVREVYYMFCVKLYFAIVTIFRSVNSSYAFVDALIDKSLGVAI